MKSNDVKIIQQDHLRIITNNNFIVVYDTKSNDLTVRSNIKLNLELYNDLDLNINGDMNINVDGNINFHSTKDISIDSKNVFINSPDTTNKQQREFMKWYYKIDNEEWNEMQQSLMEY